MNNPVPKSLFSIRSPALAAAFALVACAACALSAPVFASAIDPAPEGTFTIAVIPDTQDYHGKGTALGPKDEPTTTNPVLANHVRWIVENLATQRIAFVSHVGDITDYNNEPQWAHAQSLLDGLRGRVPFGLTIGNHDMTRPGDSTRFQKHFPASSFKEYPWYGGFFPGDPDHPGVSGNNANSYQLFSACGRDFVHLNIECNAPDNVLQWADGILEKHANRLALVTTHMDLGPTLAKVGAKIPLPDGKSPVGRMRWHKTHGELGNTPQQAWEKCYSKHANLRLIFSGDQRTTGYAHLATTGIHGNTVHALMSDYYSAGPMRLYRFEPAANRVRIITCDTTKDALIAASRWKKPLGETTYDGPDAPPVETAKRALHQFTIECDLNQPNP